MSLSTSNIDLGNLLITDYSQLNPENKPQLSESEIITHTKNNLINFFTTLYSQLKLQHEESGIDYSIPLEELTLPKPILILPRSLPIPKPKPLTKWEKFKKEKNITQRKRSRMVYSEIEGDWVPRWGKGSKKHIENQANWMLEDKNGENQFTVLANEKKLKIEKQKKREARNNLNEIIQNGELSTVKKLSKKERKKMRIQKEFDKLINDKKNLNKRLEQIQKSTRSMGKFDKKLKNEKELNVIKKKKLNEEVLKSISGEKKRDQQIIKGLFKQKK
jgi:regulator of ribosome biosynthesis